MKPYQVALTEMFKRVGLKYTVAYTKKEDWFRTKTWTVEEQESFEQWLVEYLRGSPEARDDIMARPSKQKKDLLKVAKAFTFNYGWMVK